MKSPEYKTCPRCNGCGQLASDEDGTPWREWLKLPFKDSAELEAGIVKPVLCPVCKGKGKIVSREKE